MCRSGKLRQKIREKAASSCPRLVTGESATQSARTTQPSQLQYLIFKYFWGDFCTPTLLKTNSLPHIGNAMYSSQQCTPIFNHSVLYFPFYHGTAWPSLCSLYSFKSGPEFFDHMAAAVLCFTQISALLSSHLTSSVVGSWRQIFGC